MRSTSGRTRSIWPPTVPALPSPHTVDALYSDHHEWLRNWLRRRLGNAIDAADLAHDTFVKVLVRPQAALQAREPRAWLTTIAHGLVVDHVRRQSLERAYQQAVAALSEPQAPSPEGRLLLIEALVRVDAMLDGLNPKARSAFLLSRLEGLPYTCIAEQLGVTLSSVEKYMATAIRHCLALQLAS